GAGDDQLADGLGHRALLYRVSVTLSTLSKPVAGSMRSAFSVLAIGMLRMMPPDEKASSTVCSNLNWNRAIRDRRLAPVAGGGPIVPNSPSARLRSPGRLPVSRARAAATLNASTSAAAAA